MRKGRTLKSTVLTRALLATGLLTASLLTAGQAQAQNPKDTTTGSRLAKPIDDTFMRRREQEKFIADLARCAYSWAPAGVEKFLDNSDDFGVDNIATGVKPRNLWPAYHIQACGDRALEQREDKRAFVAIEEREFRAMMLEPSYLALNPSPPAWLSAWPGAPKRKYVSTGRALALSQLSGQFADCIVAGAPRLADNLLRTVKYSLEESKAIRALVPYLGPCIVAGQKAELTPVSIRNFVADGMRTASRSFQRGDMVPPVQAKTN